MSREATDREISVANWKVDSSGLVQIYWECVGSTWFLVNLAPDHSENGNFNALRRNFDQPTKNSECYVSVLGKRIFD